MIQPRLLASLALAALDLGLVWSGSEHLLPQVAARTLNLGLLCHALAQRMHPDESREEQLVAALLYLYASLHLLLRVLAPLGWLSNGGAALSAAVLAPVGLRLLAGTPTAPPEPDGPTPRLVALARLLVLAGLVSWQGLYWGHAPVGWDGFTYHLNWPAQWRARGDLSVEVVQVGDPAVPFYPRAPALHALWWLLPGAELDPLAKHLEFPFLLGILLAGGLLIERMGVERGAARLGALLLVSSPLMVRASPNLGNDLILAFCVLAAALAACRWAESRGPADALRFGLASGMALGTKYLGLLYLPLMALPLLAPPRRLPHARLALLAFLAGVLPDYGRNLLATGNPLFPAGLTLAGVEILPGLQDLSWIYARSLSSEDFAFTMAAAFRLLGPLWFLLLPACLAAPLLAGSPRERALRALPLVAGGIFVVAMPHHHMRFLLLVVPLALGAGLVTWMRARLPSAGLTATLGAAGLLALAFTTRGDLANAQRARFARWNAYTKYGRIARIWEAVDFRVGEDESLLVALDVQSYTYRGPGGIRRILRPSLRPEEPMRYRDLEPPGFRDRWLAWRPAPGDTAEFKRALTGPGADWVLVNMVDPASQRELFERVTSLEGYRLVKQWKMARLFRRASPRAARD